MENWWCASRECMATFFFILLFVSQIAAQGDDAEPADLDGNQASVLTDGPLKDMSMMFFLTSLMGSVAAIHIVASRKLIYLPESVAIILVGIFFGIIIRFMSSAVQRFLEFEPPLFFYFVLPPIIFEAGYNLPKDIFMDNFVSILWYAVPGTLISMVIVSSAIFLLQGTLGYNYGLQDSLAFGALISATDPVATLSVFQSLDVDRVLYMLVLGESVLNDAVAIVLYRTVTSHMSIVIAILDFLYIFLGSTFVGVSTGLATAWIVKNTGVRDKTHLALSVLIILSYVSYLVGEGLRMSGLMAIFFCGIAQDHYTAYNLPSKTQTAAHEVIHLIAFMCETSTFLYVGLSVGSMSYTLDARLVAVAFLACLLARAFNVFPLTFLTNLRRKVPVPLAHQVVMWFAGLRGGVAFGLSVQISDSIPTKAVTVTTTVVIVLLTITFLGGGTLPLLQYQRGRSLGATKRLQSKEVMTMEYFPGPTATRDVTLGTDLESSGDVTTPIAGPLSTNEDKDQLMAGPLSLSPTSSRLKQVAFSQDQSELNTWGTVGSSVPLRSMGSTNGVEALLVADTACPKEGWFDRLDRVLRRRFCVDKDSSPSLHGPDGRSDSDQPSSPSRLTEVGPDTPSETPHSHHQRAIAPTDSARSVDEPRTNPRLGSCSRVRSFSTMED